MQRQDWIELLRAAGAISIVLLHVLVSTSLAAPLGPARSLAYAAVGIVCCRWAVPVFFMITGYLLLNPAKDLTWAKVGRYMGRMAGVLATFGLVFALMEEALTHLRAGTLSPLVLADAVRDVLLMRSWDHLWYVYALLFLYPLLMPLRALRSRWGDAGLGLTAALSCVVGLILPTAWGAAEAAGAVVPLTAVVPPLVTNVLAGLACVSVGGCARTLKAGPLPCVAGILSLLLMLCVSLSGVAAGRGDQGYVFLQTSPFALLYGLAVLLCVRGGAQNLRLAPHGLISRIARDSFGIYVIHPFFIHLALMVVGPLTFPPYLFEPSLLLFSLAASLGLIRLLRRMPLLSNLL